MDLSREAALARDATDPLAPLRARFVVSEPELIYLDGNSLGRLPLAARAAMAEIIESWGTDLVRGWEEWIDAPSRTGDAIARVIGAGPGEVVCCDSVTVNLYKLAGAVLAARPGDVVVAPDEFPTDRYVLAGLAEQHGVALRHDLSDLAGARVVVASAVSYRSGERMDVAGLTERARVAGAHVIWDLSHAAGAVPLALGADRAELAVGCTYKYLNAGPGATAFLYVARALQTRLRSPVQGWWGQADQFAMDEPYNPLPDARRFLAGTPSPVVLAAVQAGAELVLEAGVDALRTKSLAQTELICALHDAWLAPLGFSLGSPRDPARRGSHVALRHEQAWPITRALIERAAVIPDFRGPDAIRLAVAPLYTRFVDVWDALARLRALVAAGEHAEFAAARTRVT